MENNNLFEQATQAQLKKLMDLGYQGDLTNLTKAEASDIISDLLSQMGGGQPYGNYNKQPQYGNYNGSSVQPPKSQPKQEQVQNQVAQQKFDTTAVAKLGIADELTDSLTKLANDGALFIPESYSVGNALKSAISKIMTSDQADKLMQCTTESKKQALTEYVVQGLDASKNQAYFIPYGNKMTMMRSYFGDVAVAKETGLIKDVYAVVIYQGDEIEIGFDDYGRETLIKHTTSFENRDNDIIGAYGVAVGFNDYKAYCFMTRKELEASWKMSKAPNGKLLNDYKQEAAKRTVIRRLVKMIFNSSLNTTEQQTALIGSYNRTTEDEYINEPSNAEIVNHNNAEVKEEQKKKTASKKAAPDSEEWLNDND